MEKLKIGDIIYHKGQKDHALVVSFEPNGLMVEAVLINGIFKGENLYFFIENEEWEIVS